MRISLSICAFNYLLMEITETIEPLMPKATLKIDATTRDKLKNLSTNMEDTFDTIICRLIDHYETIPPKKD